jgi:two-component system response regulator DevR
MITKNVAIRILMVDKSALVRLGVRSVINSSGSGEFQIVGEAGSAQSAKEQASRLRPDVVLIDLHLPDGAGSDTIREILRLCPKTRVLVLTSITNDDLVYGSVIAGAHGYMMKEVDPLDLLKAISDVAAGKSVLAPDASSCVFRMIRKEEKGNSPGALTFLSKQELRVLALVAEGLTNKEVGKHLTLTENTVKNYLVNVFAKLKVKRRSQAAAIFAQANQNH